MTDSGLALADVLDGQNLAKNYLDLPWDGRVYEIDPKAGKVVRKIDSAIRFTNGTAFDAEDRLYANASFPGDVYRYDVFGTGAPKRELFGNVPQPSDEDGFKGPDGIKFGADGRLYCTADRRLVELMTGKSFDHHPIEGKFDDAPTVLEVRHLFRTGEFHDVSLSVRMGEILGITGLLGSGRTELALALFGMSAPDSDEILMHGKPITLGSNRDAITHGVAYVSEDRLSLGLVMSQPISSKIAISVLDGLTDGFGFVDSERRRSLVRKWIGALGIKVGDPENAVGTSSGGNQQRVVLAKWLATNPSLLILDSPTVGVDINATDGIYRIVRELAENGLAVIMISDEISEVFCHAHRVLVMRAGRIASEHEPVRISEATLREAVDA